MPRLRPSVRIPDPGRPIARLPVVRKRGTAEAAVGGTVADRANRHHIIVITQTTSMVLPLVLAALVFTGRVQVWHVFALAGTLGVVNAFDVPARQSFVVEMVGREDLVNAIALNSSIVNAARAIGPAVAGVLLATVGEGWCFLLN